MQQFIEANLVLFLSCEMLSNITQSHQTKSQNTESCFAGQCVGYNVTNRFVIEPSVATISIISFTLMHIRLAEVKYIESCHDISLPTTNILFVVNLYNTTVHENNV